MEINVYCLFCAIQLNLNHRIAGQKSKNKQPSFPGLFFWGHTRQMTHEIQMDKQNE